MRHAISPYGLDHILRQCSNLNCLRLLLPNGAAYIYKRGLQIPYASKSDALRHIRQLELVTGDPFKLYDRDEAPLKLISDICLALPTLESLYVSNFYLKLISNVEYCFGNLISNLNQLRELHLRNIEFDLHTLSHPTWLNRLELLELKFCWFPRRQTIQALLNSSASEHLRELRLTLRTISDHSDLEELFDLPGLLRLSLRDEWSCRLLPCFRKCHQIRSLNLNAQPYQCDFIQELVCANTWNNLRSINVSVSSSGNETVEHTAGAALQKINRFMNVV